jgi:hypothetical protein
MLKQFHAFEQCLSELICHRSLSFFAVHFKYLQCYFLSSPLAQVLSHYIACNVIVPKGVMNDPGSMHFVLCCIELSYDDPLAFHQCNF